MELMLQTFDDFRKPIDPVELNRAKNCLKRAILENMCNQGDRIEEIAKSVNFFLIIFFSITLSTMLPLINILI